jgi:hypothetical protein
MQQANHCLPHQEHWGVDQVAIALAGFDQRLLPVALHFASHSGKNQKRYWFLYWKAVVL